MYCFHNALNSDLLKEYEVHNTRSKVDFRKEQNSINLKNDFLHDRSDASGYCWEDLSDLVTTDLVFVVVNIASC